MPAVKTVCTYTAQDSRRLARSNRDNSIHRLPALVGSVRTNGGIRPTLS